ncbi:unnamed protein product [Trifolium pratense]|uniref:Uncharacterized protein n=1 Tax=Trifolium pratense TaxID=57577 RepID=A0ACB0JJL1_TRIPR|nr:unnamed protein product [Trifolium pratense]
MLQIFKPLYAMIVFISLFFVVLDVSAGRGYYCSENVWCHQVLLTGANHPLLGATLAAAIAVAVQLVAPPLTPNPS